jgi:hypothetical protein
VTHIIVKKTNGQILEVDYPFDYVHFPIRNWEFHVKEEGEILSKPPKHVATVLNTDSFTINDFSATDKFVHDKCNKLIMIDTHYYCKKLFFGKVTTDPESPSNKN